MIKKIALFFSASFLYLYGSAQGKVVVQIRELKNNKGVCRVCLFNNAESFNGTGKPVACVTGRPGNKVSEVIFENVTPGTYAISVFHDENSNSKLDKNFLGMPKEGYGASKNKLPFAAAPGFNENKFAVQNNQIVQLAIRLRNL